MERLWSVDKYVLTEQFRGMTPQLFEVLLFLKLNERSWCENGESGFKYTHIQAHDLYQDRVDNDSAELRKFIMSNFFYSLLDS